MNWKRTARWSWLAVAVLLLAVGLGGAAADPNGKLVPPPPDPVAKNCASLGAGESCIYETTENARFVGHSLVRRISTAAAQGKVGGGSPICPGSAACDITVVATDKISTVTGKGPISGTFAIVVNEPGTVDPAEVVVLRGTLNGVVDIFPALSGSAPLGSITGRWHAPGAGSGTFSGTLRFPVGSGPFFYFDDAGFSIGPFNARLVGANEMVLGFPALLFEIDFE